MKIVPPEVAIRRLLHDPNAPVFAAFAVTAGALTVALWLIFRNLRHNEPGLKAPMALTLAIVVAGSGLTGAHRLPGDRFVPVGSAVCVAAAVLFYFADWRRFVRDPEGRRRLRSLMVSDFR